jgi:hypothetical protein
MTRFPLVFGLLALSGTAWADDLQYRHFKLSDGREFDAIIESTEAIGFKVTVPQGETTVAFAQLFDMVPITKAQYDAQPNWVVYLAVPEERRKGLTASFTAIPHVSVYGADNTTASLLTPDQQQIAASCGTDVQCVGKATVDAPWMWVVGVEQQGSDFVLTAQTNKGGPMHNPIRASMIQSDAISQAAWALLEVTKSASTSVVDNPPPTEHGPVKPGLAFVPLPGITALANHDGAGFGIAMAAAVPATALWVGAVGKGAASTPAQIGLSVGGFYAITVALNTAVAMRGGESADVSFGVAPTAGGAQVGISGRL